MLCSISNLCSNNDMITTTKHRTHITISKRVLLASTQNKVITEAKVYSLESRMKRIKEQLLRACSDKTEYHMICIRAKLASNTFPNRQLCYS